MAVMEGGFIGNEPIKALYRGKELIWQKQEEGGIPSYYKLATDDDFKRVIFKGFEYVGTKEYIILPERIQGRAFNISEMFKGTAIKGVAGKASNRGSAQEAFEETTADVLELLYFDTSNVTDMSRMFFNSSATTLDLSSFNTSNVTDMSRMFFNSSANVLDLSSFDTSNVTDMSSMFYGAEASTIDLSSFNTSNVTDMSSMFAGSRANVLDLSSFDTSNVTDMDNMFRGALVRVGYARTQEDADRFNNSSGKSSLLTFVVKPN